MRKMKTWKMRTHTVGTGRLLENGMRTHTVGTGRLLENGGNMENETLTL